MAWFHYARNNVFSRLRLVISRRFRLVGSTTKIPRTGLAQRTRTTGNGDDTALQFATRTPRISSSGKTRQKFPLPLPLPPTPRTTISINSPLLPLDIALSSAELYKRVPETSSFTTLTTCFRRSANCSVLRSSTSNVAAQHNVRSGRRRQKCLVRGGGLISVCIALSTFSSAGTAETACSRLHG